MAVSIYLQKLFCNRTGIVPIIVSILTIVSAETSIPKSFIDKFGRMPKGVERWAEIVSYNLFRMDGVSLCLPETDTPALVMNWEEGKMERFDGEEDSLPTTKRNTRRKGDKRS